MSDNKTGGTLGIHGNINEIDDVDRVEDATSTQNGNHHHSAGEEATQPTIPDNVPHIPVMTECFVPLHTDKAFHPSRVFARGLLTTEDMVLNSPSDEGDKIGTPSIRDDIERSVIVAFDKLTLAEKCTEGTPTYTNAVADFDEICVELFSAGRIWSSRDLLHTAVNAVASTHGWTAGLTDRYIQCNRYGESRTRSQSSITSERPANLSHGELKVNCTFSIPMKPLFNIKSPRAKTANSVKKRYKYKPLWNRPVEIGPSVTTHGGGVNPG